VGQALHPIDHPLLKMVKKTTGRSIEATRRTTTKRKKREAREKHGAWKKKETKREEYEKSTRRSRNQGQSNCHS
jgi:hypothetical protein